MKTKILSTLLAALSLGLVSCNTFRSTPAVSASARPVTEFDILRLRIMERMANKQD